MVKNFKLSICLTSNVKRAFFIAVVASVFICLPVNSYAKYCSSDRGCEEEEQVCSWGVCVDCVKDSDCDSDEWCDNEFIVTNNRCVERRDSGESCIGYGGQGTCKDNMVCDLTRYECRHVPGKDGEVCSNLLPCEGDLVCQGWGEDGTGFWRCEAKKKIGEACTNGDGCEDDLVCRLCISPFDGQTGGQGCIGAMVCFPDTEESHWYTDICLGVYSSDLHEYAQEKGYTFSYGTGADASVGISAVIESGTVYGPDGQFGCYRTTCIGAKLNASAELYYTVGKFMDWSYVAGESIMQVAGGGEVINFGGALIHSMDLLTIYAYTGAVGAGVGVLPVESGFFDCDTVLMTVMGNSPPEAVCADKTECADAADCTKNVSIDDGSHDDDGDALNYSWEPLGPYSIGCHDVTLTVTTDPLGSPSSSSCQADVCIEDCTSPDVICPSAVVAECQSALQASVDPGAASASDSCSDVTVNDPGIASYPLGKTVVEYTATDSWGNTDSCYMLVTVVDTTAPEIICPSAVVAECQSALQASVDPGDASATDICSTTSTTDPGFASYPLGETLVTYTATDTSGNSTSCNMTVTVADTTPPAISCNVFDITPPEAPISFSASAPDICDSVEITITDYDCFKYTKKGKRIDKTGSCEVSINADTVTITDSGGVGDIITWTVMATDPSGNSSSEVCQVTVLKP